MWSDNETKEDPLGFKVHASLVKDAVLDKELSPVIIGVFGDWGRVYEKDKKNDITIWPWCEKRLVPLRRL